jgi:hypothetical protein
MKMKIKLVRKTLLIYRKILFLKVALYCSLLEDCIIKDSEGVQIIPELYAVPGDRVNSIN